VNASREAFDLWSPGCRRNFRHAFARKWLRGSWWKLVATDTWNRVCSKEPEEFQHLPHVGDYFRIEWAKHYDRSYIDNIYRCVSRQDGAVMGEIVHGAQYSRGNRLFVAGDVKFYNASKHAKFASIS
jgi:hypothetical protein